MMVDVFFMCWPIQNISTIFQPSCLMRIAISIFNRIRSYITVLWCVRVAGFSGARERRTLLQLCFLGAESYVRECAAHYAFRAGVG